jgi:hypothetical protein
VTDQPRESFWKRREQWVRRHPWLGGLIVGALAFGLTLLLDGVLLNRDDVLFSALFRAIFLFVVTVGMAKMPPRVKRERPS